jgi:hypothetical protein
MTMDDYECLWLWVVACVRMFVVNIYAEWLLVNVYTCFMFGCPPGCLPSQFRLSVALPAAFMFQPRQAWSSPIFVRLSFFRCPCLPALLLVCMSLCPHIISSTSAPCCIPGHPTCSPPANPPPQIPSRPSIHPTHPLPIPSPIITSSPSRRAGSSPMFVFHVLSA